MRMGWSPPKKSTVVISAIVLIVGIIIAFLQSSWNPIDISGLGLPDSLGLYLALGAWAFLLIGVKFPGV
jgi:hypothetical protein